MKNPITTFLSLGLILIITSALVILISYQMYILNINDLIRFITAILTVTTFTSVFHFALERPVRNIRERFGQKSETIVEHLLFYFLALIIWSIIDYGYFFQSDITPFIIEKIWLFGLSIPLIYFYSSVYVLVTEKRYLALEIGSLILAFTVGSFFELQLFLNRSNTVQYNNFVTQIIVIIVVFSILTAIVKLKQRKII